MKTTIITMDSQRKERDCQSCSICISTATATASLNADERRPLLDRNRTVIIGNEEFYPNLFLVGGLCIFLLTGICMGGYLLITEGNEWNMSGMYMVVSRNEWGAEPAKDTLSMLSTPVNGVLLTQENTTCKNKLQCIAEMGRLQETWMANNPDIGHNFVIGGDGRIYEGCGWGRQCNPTLNDNILTIGVMGEFTNDPPSRLQLNELRILLQIAVDKRMLSRCYSVIVRKDTNLNERVMVEIAGVLQSEAMLDC